MDQTLDRSRMDQTLDRSRPTVADKTDRCQKQVDLRQSKVVGKQTIYLYY
ncbi:hypothetical protein ISN44_As05g027030 [Arabidopsis suecica]|uniref:Uncharacterized protein n=1 Tax=Arabidopsis suecica TaxID=45249 RepID=A0A8T2DJR4_ARASU|nr:hypothetical protein ISN44_As05g027030 [Arabidopsis suecica]